MINVLFYVLISSVKRGHLKTLIRTQQAQFSLPILWGHLAHFEPDFIFHNYYNLNCELVP